MIENLFTFLRHTVFAATGLILMLALLHLALRPFEKPKDLGVLSAKKAALSERADSYDAIFLGTSQTFRNIDPDGIEAAANCPLSVYNAGVPGLVLEELSDFIATLGETGTTGKLIIFNDPLPPRPDFNAVTNVRTQSYTTYANLPDRYRNIWSLPAPLWKKAALSGFSIGAYAYKFLGIGLLSKILFPHVSVTPEKYLPGLNKENGYPDLRADIKNNEEIATRARRFQGRADKWQDNVLAKQGAITPPSENMIEAAKRRANLIKTLANKITEQGNSPAFIVFPETETHRQDLALIAAVQKAAPELAIINGYERANAKGLWNKEYVFYEAHLNMKGATLFSKSIAGQICNIYQSSGGGE
ncbi:MAG: hypothetical protein CMH28_03975 [Micavibrio sp.]|nr:hypothetical protein [Micavibrio sp.]|tara:strand:- start:1154 stop:2230 length:1077 start_codon:yes stop_codon:yes gene_type:complete